MPASGCPLRSPVDADLSRGSHSVGGNVPVRVPLSELQQCHSVVGQRRCSSVAWSSGNNQFTNTHGGLSASFGINTTYRHTSVTVPHYCFRDGAFVPTPLAERLSIFVYRQAIPFRYLRLRTSNATAPPGLPSRPRGSNSTSNTTPPSCAASDHRRRGDSPPCRGDRTRTAPPDSPLPS